MKRLVYIIAALWALGIASCVVTASPGSCEALTCADALAQGLQVQGDTLCDAQSDSDYSAVINCACQGGNGPCDDACGANLCMDLGESSACGDCLDQTCPSEHTTCAND